LFEDTKRKVQRKLRVWTRFFLYFPGNKIRQSDEKDAQNCKKIPRFLPQKAKNLDFFLPFAQFLL
jgi:hypothetical protein